MLFGDGSGAVVLEASEANEGVLSVALGDGEGVPLRDGVGVALRTEVWVAVAVGLLCGLLAWRWDWFIDLRVYELGASSLFGGGLYDARFRVADLPFTYLHVFTYSSRPGTAAAKMASHVAPQVARERNRVLRELIAENMFLRQQLIVLERQVNRRGQGLGALLGQGRSERVRGAPPHLGAQPVAEFTEGLEALSQPESLPWKYSGRPAPSGSRAVNQKRVARPMLR